jgi:hypothetical protein
MLGWMFFFLGFGLAYADIAAKPSATDTANV